MLYRELRTHLFTRAGRAVLGFAASLFAARRRRLAQRDLLDMNPALKRDIGLYDLDLSEFGRRI